MANDRGRILLVEDATDLATILRCGLEGMHYCCLETHTANEALKAARFFRPDLVLLDLKLGGKASWPLLQRLKLEHKKPILVMSATRDYDYQREAMKLGAACYPEKPFSLRDLLDQVSAVLP